MIDCFIYRSSVLFLLKMNVMATALRVESLKYLKNVVELLVHKVKKSIKECNKLILDANKGIISYFVLLIYIYFPIF